MLDRKNTNLAFPLPFILTQLTLLSVVAETAMIYHPLVVDQLNLKKGQPKITNSFLPRGVHLRQKGSIGIRTRDLAHLCRLFVSKQGKTSLSRSANHTTRPLSQASPVVGSASDGVF